MEAIKKHKLQTEMDLDSKPIQLGCPHLYRSMSEKLLNSAVPYFSCLTNEALNNNLKCMLKTKNNNLHKGLEHITGPQSSSSFLGTVHNLQTCSMVIGQIMHESDHRRCGLGLQPPQLYFVKPQVTQIIFLSFGIGDQQPKGPNYYIGLNWNNIFS